VAVADSIRCSNCGGPVEFKPGEILATCRYCGFLTVIETGKPFDFEHSLLQNKFDNEQIDGAIKNWMRSGFLKPSDLARKSKIEEEYNWLVLARKASDFPTREYDVPLEGKIPYDFRKIEEFAKVLNSEIERAEATDLARQQIEAQQRYLLQKDVDRIIEMSVEFNEKQIVYLHAPLWFIKYVYKGVSYQLIIDGVSGVAVKGDIPAAKF
jgi:hypothetical protein